MTDDTFTAVLHAVADYYDRVEARFWEALQKGDPVEYFKASDEEYKKLQERFRELKAKGEKADERG